MESQENLRTKFKSETAEKLWAEDLHKDAGFSDNYVNWLENKLIKQNRHED